MAYYSAIDKKTGVENLLPGRAKSVSHYSGAVEMAPALAPAMTTSTAPALAPAVDSDCFSAADYQRFRAQSGKSAPAAEKSGWDSNLATVFTTFNELQLYMDLNKSIQRARSKSPRSRSRSPVAPSAQNGFLTQNSGNGILTRKSGSGILFDSKPMKFQEFGGDMDEIYAYIRRQMDIIRQKDYHILRQLYKVQDELEKFKLDQTQKKAPLESKKNIFERIFHL